MSTKETYCCKCRHRAGNVSCSRELYYSKFTEERIGEYQDRTPNINGNCPHFKKRAWFDV